VRAIRHICGLVIKPGRACFAQRARLEANDAGGARETRHGSGLQQTLQVDGDIVAAVTHDADRLGGARPTLNSL
jgi:hypothetical protein